MEILQAYCVELDDTVDIYEAQSAYFDTPRAVANDLHSAVPMKNAAASKIH
ncbi:hypothetical protein O0881_04345 [Janthinobacterium sp. SUN100]|uniref:hypothetical protein n=1 Tax=Janthinobacterium sp. SUN100 TaxID=3004101 RepID=UPI0025B0FFB4|nr:hypothetical protein [Janthinobacterium sp. SUN100]MDN2701225.1 hypothetical protein [Janthinobacterium sp. SUN100]